MATIGTIQLETDYAEIARRPLEASSARSLLWTSRVSCCRRSGRRSDWCEIRSFSSDWLES